jgi:hypothetical protein
MTVDVIALCRQRPELGELLGALRAAGPDLRVATHPSGTVLRLLDAEERPLLSVEGPLLVQAPGEVRRLLGPKLPGIEPVWWVETRAVSGRDEAVSVAYRFAEALAGALDGLVWPPPRGVEGS